MREWRLVCIEYRAEIVLWRWTFRRCLLRLILVVACLVEVVKLSIKSGIARERGSMIPSPPALRDSWEISRAWCGRIAVPMRSEINFAMMWLVAEVKGPFQSVQVGGGFSVS